MYYQERIKTRRRREGAWEKDGNDTTARRPTNTIFLLVHFLGAYGEALYGEPFELELRFAGEMTIPSMSEEGGVEEGGKRGLQAFTRRSQGGVSKKRPLTSATILRYSVFSNWVVNVWLLCMELSEERWFGLCIARYLTCDCHTASPRAQRKAGE